MKFRNDHVRHASCALLTAFVATATLAQSGAQSGAQTGAQTGRPGDQRAGPAADYPVVIGAPFTVDGVTYTPVDAMNYDQVGYALTGQAGGGTITLAHRTLPLPSYVEVTSLKTGKTILVRAERRGPMTGSALIELSPGAATQLGAGAREPVRVRRVNPPEPERALLRMGQRAPERMDTPMPLVGVLMRKLEPSAPLAPPVASPPAAAAPVLAAKPAVPGARPGAKPAARPETKAPATAGSPAPKPAPAPVKPAPAKPAPSKPVEAAAAPPASPPAAAAQGRFTVQVGAFASSSNAAKAAKQVGGTISPAGKLTRVRIGSYSSAADAAAALAKAKAAGYTDARIQRAD